MAEISPYLPEDAPDTNPAIIAAMNIMQATYLPKGMDDAGEPVASQGFCKFTVAAAG